MREGDFIISVGDKDVKWSSHEEVVALIQKAGDSLALRLATPMDKSLAKVRSRLSQFYFSHQCRTKFLVMVKGTYNA